LAAAGAGEAGEPEVLLPFAGGVGVRSGLAMLPGEVSMGFVPTGGGTWLAAAGAGDAGEPEVLDCANAKPALPAMAKAVREVVRAREIFMGAFVVAARGSVCEIQPCIGAGSQVMGSRVAGLCENAPNV
jgi:hypothetical protein